MRNYTIPHYFCLVFFKINPIFILPLIIFYISTGFILIKTVYRFFAFYSLLERSFIPAQSKVRAPKVQNNNPI